MPKRQNAMCKSASAPQNKIKLEGVGRRRNNNATCQRYVQSHNAQHTVWELLANNSQHNKNATERTGYNVHFGKKAATGTGGKGGEGRRQKGRRIEGGAGTGQGEGSEGRTRR